MHFPSEYTSIAKKIAEASEKALRQEAATTPKPGLVDTANNGAHTDMDLATFYASAAALAPYFEEIAHLGACFSGKAEELLPAIRPIGLRAEDAMRKATGGVNTHKGAIFSLGILCAAAGFAWGRGLPRAAGDLLALCGQIAAKTPQELDARKPPATHGEQAYARMGITGVRGQAAAGYPDVRQYGYPIFTKRLAAGDSLNDAAVASLLHLIAYVDDTNLLRRGGAAALQDVRQRLKEDLAALDATTSDVAANSTSYTPALLHLAAAWDVYFIRHNLSPGGSADLLALTLMLHFLSKNI